MSKFEKFSEIARFLIFVGSFRFRPSLVSIALLLPFQECFANLIFSILPVVLWLPLGASSFAIDQTATVFIVIEINHNPG